MTTRAALILTTATDDETLRSLALPWSAFGIVCHLALRKLEGHPAPTRDELAEQLPISERTLDGALADLRRRGLIESAKVEKAA